MARARTPSPIRAYGSRLLALFLILWTPFLSFWSYRGDPIPTLSFLYSAILFGLFSLFLAALMGRSKGLRQCAVFTFAVCLFLDFQFEWFSDLTAYAVSLSILAAFWLVRAHLPFILSAIFLTILAAIGVIPPTDPYVEREISLDKGPDQIEAEVGRGQQWPTVVHLVLDEYAGIQGLPTDVAGGAELREQQRAFFTSYGFKLFGNAISEYASSKSSISGILNFTAGEHPEVRYHGKRPYILKGSKYFELLHESGYRIHVYQSTYMDFCTDLSSLIDRCYIFRYDGTDWLKTASLDHLDKFKALLGVYLSLSEIFESVWKLYIRTRDFLSQSGIDLPLLMDWDGRTGPINSMSTFDLLIDDIVQSPPGTVYFAHLLMPHGPYVFDAGCQLRPGVLKWRKNSPLHRKENTQSSRALRYRLYFDQVRCTTRRLQELFERMKSAGLFADALIIVHGDHGSRIFRVATRAKNKDRLARQDLLDGFSTLFAVRSPAVDGGLSERIRPVSGLLGEIMGLAHSNPSSTSELDVYLEGRNDEPWIAVPWPMAN